MSLYDSYAEWLNGLRDWLSVDDYTDSKLAMFLNLAHRRLNRELQSYNMEKQQVIVTRSSDKKLSNNNSFDDVNLWDPQFVTITKIEDSVEEIDPAVYNYVWEMKETATNASHYLNCVNPVTIPSNTIATVSIIYKRISGSKNLVLEAYNVDYTAGVTLTVNNTGSTVDLWSSDTTVLSSGTIDLTNGYFRAWITFISNSEIAYQDVAFKTVGGAYVYLGDGLSKYNIQHFEVEYGELTPVDNYSVFLPLNISLAIPDFGKIRLVAISPQGSLDVVPVDKIKNDIYNATTLDKSEYNIDANVLTIYPMPPSGTYIDFYYYENVPMLSETVNSNTFSLYHDDALLYAACVEGAVYMVEDDRLQMWNSKYVDIVESSNNSSKHIKAGSVPLKRQFKVGN